jgi:hypothetical protein
LTIKKAFETFWSAVKLLTSSRFFFATRISMLRSHIVLLAVASILVIGACTSPTPVEESEERPSAEKVARSAAAMTTDAENDGLVLYSSSMEEAELDVGDAEVGVSEIGDADAGDKTAATDDAGLDAEPADTSKADTSKADTSKQESQAEDPTSTQPQTP